MRASLLGATDPAVIGDAVVRAVKSRQFWLLPNAGPYADTALAELDELRDELLRIRGAGGGS